MWLTLGRDPAYDASVNVSPEDGTYTSTCRVRAVRGALDAVASAQGLYCGQDVRNSGPGWGIQASSVPKSVPPVRDGAARNRAKHMSRPHSTFTGGSVCCDFWM